MSALQWIVKEAKSIKKQFPKRFKKWTEYVAQASAIYASKHKGKSPVGKKKVGSVVKKTVKKKKAKLTTEDKKDKSAFNAMARKHKKARVGALKLKPNEMRLGLLSKKVGATVKKKTAKKKAVSNKHIDTKSHNVNIKVMSGVSNKALQDLKETINKIEIFEKQLLNHKMAIKVSKNPEHKNIYKKQLIGIKKYLSELKTHARELKKHI
jgi:hypothetical protein